MSTPKFRLSHLRYRRLVFGGAWRAEGEAALVSQPRCSCSLTASNNTVEMVEPAELHYSYLRLVIS